MIKSFELSHGALHAVERLDADVMLFSNPDAAERNLLHSHFKLDEHVLASALDKIQCLDAEPASGPDVQPQRNRSGSSAWRSDFGGCQIAFASKPAPT
ncbi:hypothetical protein ABIA60_003548 [Pseudomonas frederiksbergensis]